MFGERKGGHGKDRKRKRESVREIVYRFLGRVEGEMRSREIFTEAAEERERRERNWEQDYGSRGERERAK